MNQQNRNRQNPSSRRTSQNPSRRPTQNHDDADLLPENVRQHVADHDGRSDEEPDTTGALEPLTEASPQDWLGSNQDPDVLLSVPNLGVDHIGLDVENLHARIDVHARVLDLVDLRVGADVTIDDVQLDIDNVQAQAMLKVKLEKVYDIVSEAMGLLRDNPDILTELTDGIERELESELETELESELESELETEPERSIEAWVHERKYRSEYE